MRFTEEELKIAKRRLDTSSDRGSDEKYFADVFSELIEVKERIKELEFRIISRANLDWRINEDEKTSLRIKLCESYEREKKFKAVAEALLECERVRVQDGGVDLPPDRQLYMRAVELAREALKDGEGQ